MVIPTVRLMGPPLSLSGSIARNRSPGPRNQKKIPLPRLPRREVQEGDGAPGDGLLLFDLAQDALQLGLGLLGILLLVHPAVLVDLLVHLGAPGGIGLGALLGARDQALGVLAAAGHHDERLHLLGVLQLGIGLRR